MAGESTIVATQYPDVFGYITTVFMEEDLTTALGPHFIFVADRDMVIDNATVISPQTDANANINIRVCDSAEAIGSGEIVGTNVTGITANTAHTFTIDETKNLVTAGQAIAFNFGDPSTNALNSVTITIRYRTRIK